MHRKPAIPLGRARQPWDRAAGFVSASVAKPSRKPFLGTGPAAWDGFGPFAMAKVGVRSGLPGQRSRGSSGAIDAGLSAPTRPKEAPAVIQGDGQGFGSCRPVALPGDNENARHEGRAVWIPLHGDITVGALECPDRDW